MILAVDTYYTDDRAHTVAVLFEAWTDARPTEVISAWREGIAAYEPGQFYKRELPCILDLLRQVDLSPLEAIVIDGFVVLDDAGSPGLGAHLYEALEKRVPVIGVAKTNFATIHAAKIEVLRGDSVRPLYITATGMDLALAADHIRAMHGAYPLPDLLKALDQLTKEPGR
jgi:deoxyribonuclease V